MVPLLRFVAILLLGAGAVAAVLTWPDRSLTGMTRADVATCRADIVFNSTVGRPPPDCAALLPLDGETVIANVQYAMPVGVALSGALSALVLFALAQILTLLGARTSVSRIRGG